MIPEPSSTQLETVHKTMFTGDPSRMRISDYFIDEQTASFQVNEKDGATGLGYRIEEHPGKLTPFITIYPGDIHVSTFFWTMSSTDRIYYRSTILQHLGIRSWEPIIPT